MSNVNASSLTGPRVLLPASALLLLISSFLPWYHYSFGFGAYSASASLSGWHQIGVVAWIFTILLLAYEGARLAGVLPLDGARADLGSVALAALTLLFGVIFLIVRFSDGGLGWGLWIGLIAIIGVAAGAFLLFQGGDARAAMRDLQAQAQNRRGAAPPPPPPPAV